ncbi:MAG: hypothetical protein Q8K62_05985 [Thiobacillus sp.]|nr:hypothetical protein [Thiobacillus sp.]
MVVPFAYRVYKGFGVNNPALEAFGLLLLFDCGRPDGFKSVFPDLLSDNAYRLDLPTAHGDGNALSP